MGAIQNTQSLRILTEEESKHQLIYVFSLQNMICMTVAVASKYLHILRFYQVLLHTAENGMGLGGGLLQCNLGFLVDVTQHEQC